LLAGFGTTIFAVWGYDIVACNGFIAGAVSAAMRVGFLVFVHTPSLVACLLILALCTAVAYRLSVSAAFRSRQELLPLLLPPPALLLGVAAGKFTHLSVICTLHPWA
jgi:hypothetical protein